MVGDSVMRAVVGSRPVLGGIIVNDDRLSARRWGRCLLDDYRFAMVVIVVGDYSRTDNCSSHDAG